jgi:polyhydroxyalkanoate synthesis repressor PhaR
MATARTRQDKDKPTVIKKYANRRLYDTGRSSYVTLDDLCIMVKEGRDFVVYDAKTGEDLTRSVLTQIIVDQEAKEGQSMLPTSFLRQLIGFYGDSLQNLMPNYLEQTISAFSNNQEQFRKQFGDSLKTVMPGMVPNMMGSGAGNPVSAMEEMGRKNMEMFQNAMRAWAPFGSAIQTAGRKTAQAAGNGAVDMAKAATSVEEDRVQQLKKHIAEMEKELHRLSGE